MKAVNTIIDALLYILLICWQWVLIWTIHRQVTKIRLNLKTVGISILLTVLVTPILNGLWIITILPFMLIHTYLHDRYQPFRLIYFYSIYTSFISLLLTNLIGLSFYLFLPAKVYAIKEIQVIGIVILPILIHWLTLKIMHINFTVLKEDVEYIRHDILLPANRILTIEFLIFLVVYTIETVKNATESLEMYTAYIFFVYIFMFFALLAFLGIQARNYLIQEIKDAKAEQYENSLPYYLEIEQLYRELAGFRHDFTNILLSLEESIKTEDIALIKSVYSDVLSEAQVGINRTKLNVADLSNVLNPALKSVISAKVLAAQQKNILVTLEVKENIENCYIDLLDYIRIVSNLLDNAIEGAIVTKKRLLRIALFYKDDLFFTHIENSANTKNMTIDRMFSNGFSSKGTSHGHGLNNVQRILQKYPNNWIETTINNGQIIQTIIIKKVS
ncbi:GHKL domain-containing protein [Lactiplantibacillus pentosus]|jgi:two-component system sensor histidine kinase AgrC|nr:GHKL domain-containing protein [Lactiplantibacillus pentosus]